MLALLLAGCGGPMLRNVPRPNPAYVATGAAAVAAIITLADPDGAERTAERAAAANAPTDASPLVPVELLDQLDAP